MTEKEKLARKSLTCLYLAVHEDIAKDVAGNVTAALDEKNDALLRYGKHERDCNYSHISKSDIMKFTPCTCGLHDILHGKKPEPCQN